MYIYIYIYIYIFINICIYSIVRYRYECTCMVTLSSTPQHHRSTAGGRGVRSGRRQRIRRSDHSGAHRQRVATGRWSQETWTFLTDFLVFVRGNLQKYGILLFLKDFLVFFGGEVHFWLVVWNIIFIFHILWIHHPNWRTHIFQRGWNHHTDLSKEV